MEPDPSGPLVIGMGNLWRGDDGAGPTLVQLLKRSGTCGVRFAECAQDGTALFSLWKGQPCVVVVDAVSSGAPAGTLHRFDAQRESIPSRFFNYSTHAFSLAEAVEVSRSLGTLPDRLILYGVEGETFGFGRRLSRAVRRAVQKLARSLSVELSTLNGERAS